MSYLPYAVAMPTTLDDEAQWSLTGAMLPAACRRGELIGRSGWLDAPDFLPTGSALCPWTGVMIPRDGWEAVEAYDHAQWIPE